MHVGPHVAAAQDRYDLEKAGHGRTRTEVGGLVGVEHRLLVEKLDPQEGAHPLGKRLLESDRAVLWCERRKLGGRIHFAILRDRAAHGKLHSRWWPTVVLRPASST